MQNLLVPTVQGGLVLEVLQVTAKVYLVGQKSVAMLHAYCNAS